MKIYLIPIILLSTVFSKRIPFKRNRYSDVIKKITVNKALEVKTTKEDYVEKVSKLDVPSKVKQWVKNLNALKKNSESNIELVYNQTKGGYAKAELYYFHKEKNEYTFKYGTAEVILGPLKPYSKRKCGRSCNPKRPPRCYYVTITPFYDQKDFKNFVTNIIKSAIQSKINNKYKKRRTG